MLANSIKKHRINKEGVAGLCFAMAPVLGFIIFGLIPLVMADFMSFMTIKGYSFDNSFFVGIKNYKATLVDKTFYRSIGNTLIAACTMPVNIVMSLIIASLLNQNKVGTRFYRLVFFLPYVCSAVAISTMWKFMYDYNFGIFNRLITKLGGEPVPWLSDKKWFLPSIMIMKLWGNAGFSIILYSASLGNVPKSYYEAARLDGATRPQLFFKITIPCVSPTTFFLVVTGLIGALQDFTRFQTMGGGALGAAGLSAVYYLYRIGFEYVTTEGMGKASAVSLLLAAFIILLTRINFWLSKYWVHYEQ